MVDTAEFLYSLLCLLACQLLRVLKKYVSMALCSKPPSRKRLADLPVVVVGKTIHPHPVAAAAEEAIDSAVSNQREEKYGRPEKENKKADVEQQQNLEPNFSSTATATEAVVVEEEGENRAVLHKRSTRRRPARLQIPSKPSPVDRAALFGGTQRERDAAVAFGKQVEVEGGEYYCVASKKGQRRLVMEDGYGVISNIHGDPKQAFFGVFDGHGGRAAVDFVSEKLGKNIVTALDELQQHGDHAAAAIKAGYLTTDREFLSQGVSSGACAATVLVKDGELHVANVGDCRVVISEKGVATALTDDHSAEREDERDRIENYGGLVTCKNGVWRVQDTLAVTRAIGDSSLKEWIISEPATRKMQLSSDCEFLILGSDGLWDKVTNQEAVDVVSRNVGDSIDQSCKDLIQISCSRGNRDDITVMVIRLDKFFCGLV